MSYIVYILIVITTLYALSIAWVFVGFLKKRKRDDKTLQAFVDIDAISIIIPVRNEEGNILNCLRSIERLDFDKNLFEVIIIDDHSTDNTALIVQDFTKKSSLTIHLKSLLEETSKKKALEEGIRVAKFNKIATTDADCTVPKNWLNIIVNNLDQKNDMLLGPVMFNKQNSMFSAFQTLDMMAIQGIEFGALAYDKPILNNAANLSYTLQSLKSVDGFDSFKTPSGDDIFLLERFKRENKLIKGKLNDAFIVETKQEETLSGFFNQRMRWASKSRFYSDRLLLFFSGIILLQNISLLFVYAGILFVENRFLTFTILLITKWLIDFILLFLVADFFKRKSALFYFIPVQMIYPLYLVLVWGASVFLKFEWKGRKY